MLQRDVVVDTSRNYSRKPSTAHAQASNVSPPTQANNTTQELSSILDCAFGGFPLHFPFGCKEVHYILSKNRTRLQTSPEVQAVVHLRAMSIEATLRGPAAPGHAAGSAYAQCTPLRRSVASTALQPVDCRKEH